MDWTPGGMSEDVEDRRGDSGGGGGFGFGGGGGGIGIVGFLVLLVISLISGRNFLGSFLSGGGGGTASTPVQTGPREAGSDGTARPLPAGEDRDAQLVSFVLDDVQKTWTGIFAAEGKQYRHAKLVLYRGATYSGCGTARASTGPFYCPQDEKVYIDLDFWDELKKFGGDTGDFAQAYVIAHELGHHVQDLLGIESKMRQATQQHPDQANQLVGGPGVAGGLFCGGVGALDRAAEHCASGRHCGGAQGGGCGRRRPPAKDERAGGESGELYPRIEPAAAVLVQARAGRRDDRQLPDIWELGCE